MAENAAAPALPLVILQENAPVGHYGDGGLHSFTINLYSSSGGKVEPGDVKITFTAPEGWTWVAYAAWYYYEKSSEKIISTGYIASQAIQIDSKRTTMSFQHDPHLFAGDNDHDYLCYNVAIEPVQNAAVGTSWSGSVTVGDAKLSMPIKIAGIIDAPQ